MFTGSIEGFLVCFSDCFKFSTTRVNYYMARNFQSCDSLCDSVQQVCASTDHGLGDAKSVLAIFKRLGVNCTTGGHRDNFSFTLDPLYRTAAKTAKDQKRVGRCLGFKDVPTSINCRSRAIGEFGSLLHRLCLCRGNKALLRIT